MNKEELDQLCGWGYGFVETYITHEGSGNRVYSTYCETPDGFGFALFGKGVINELSYSAFVETAQGRKEDLWIKKNAAVINSFVKSKIREYPALKVEKVNHITIEKILC